MVPVFMRTRRFSPSLSGRFAQMKSYSQRSEQRNDRSPVSSSSSGRENRDQSFSSERWCSRWDGEAWSESGVTEREKLALFTRMLG